jgi:pathogen-inducible salicylic acid glucosyltransferase
MREVASGLLDADRPFICVVRAPEARKLPAGYSDACGRHDGGLVVS